MATKKALENINPASQVVLRVLEMVGHSIPSTKVVKLVYLVDYAYFQHYGETLSGLEYQWDHYGPNALDHAIVGHADSLVSAKLLERESRFNFHGGQTHRYGISPAVSPPQFPAAGEMVIEDIVAQYGKLSVDAITKVSKQTAPFKDANQYDRLRMEQTAPAVRSATPDWEAHVSELGEQGTVSLEELIEEYRLA